jgi:hypothetical protein
MKAGKEAVDQDEWVEDDPTFVRDTTYDPPEWLGEFLLCYWMDFAIKPWELDEAPLVWISRLQEMRYQFIKRDITVR